MDFTVATSRQTKRAIFIPLEILQKILKDSIDDSRTSYYCSSLVCKLWHKETIPILFRDLIVTSRYAADDIQPFDCADEFNMLNTDTGAILPRKTVPSLLQFLRNTPHVCAHVRHLSLHRKSQINPARHPSADIAPEDLLSIIRCLPRLRSLRWDNFLLQSLDSIKPLPAAESPELRRLSISQSHRTDIDIDDIMAIISLLPSIDDLDLSCIAWSANPPRRDVAMRPNLHGLELDYDVSGNPAFWTTLGKFMFPKPSGQAEVSQNGALQVLHLTIESLESLAFVAEVLANSYASLTSLSLHFDLNDDSLAHDGAENYLQLDLTRCSSLAFLHIEYILRNGDLSPVIPAVMRTLNQLSRPGIKVPSKFFITFEIECPGFTNFYEGLAPMSLAALDKLLQVMDFKKIRVCFVCNEPHSKASAAVHRLRTELAQVHATGRLSFIGFE